MTEATQQIEMEVDNSINSDKTRLHGKGSSDFIRLLSWTYFLVSVAASFYLMAKLDGPTIGWSAGLVISSLMFLAVSHVLAAISDNIRLIAKKSLSTELKAEVDQR